jgi:type II secretory pathway component GspD/PulD (secretin)
MSTALKLRQRLSSVVDGLSVLIQTLPVLRIKQDSNIVWVNPQCYWGKLSHDQSARQLALKRQYEPISELLTLLLRQAPNSLMERLREANKNFRSWLELDSSNWSVSPNADRSVKEMRKAAEQLEQILSVLDNTGKGEVILVPDTNALLATADPTQYRQVVANHSFTFMLLPSVLGRQKSKLRLNYAACK